MDFLPEKSEIIEPEGGWKEQAYYIVEVAFCRSNVVHTSLFYTGFLNGGKHGDEGIPGGYNGFAFSEDNLSYQDVYYMRARDLVVIKDEDFELKKV